MHCRSSLEFSLLISCYKWQQTLAKVLIQAIVLQNICWNGKDGWSVSTKERWTFGFFPSVRDRMLIPLQLDHYAIQIVSRHGDFNSKLNSFKLIESPLCLCGENDETAEHFLYSCIRNDENRRKMIETLIEDGCPWPCAPCDFTLSKKRCEALRRFSRNSLVRKEEDRQILNANDENQQMLWNYKYTNWQLKHWKVIKKKRRRSLE